MIRKMPFNLVELLATIVILSFVLSSIIVSLNQSTFKVIVAKNLIRSVHLAEMKLESFRSIPWSEIPSAEEGLLAPEESEAMKYQMVSALQINEFGGYIHVQLKISVVSDAEDVEYLLVTDIPVPESKLEEMEEARLLQGL